MKNPILSARESRLFWDIIECDNIEGYYLGKNQNPCSKIIRTQKKIIENFQIPEPWSGSLLSPVLILSSNPSISTAEMYPTRKWKKEDVEDFFVNRFNKESGWVRNYLYPVVSREQNRYKDSWVRFWAGVRARARELYGRNDVIPGVDYALSEIVHCKSKKEAGVTRALSECCEQYLDRLIGVSSSRIVVGMGKIAEDALRERYNIIGNAVSMPALGDRVFVFLPHPNARCKRSFEEIIPERLNELRSLLKSD